MFKKLNNYIRSSRGFTLIELMATLAILALIVVIAVPAIGNIIASVDEKSEAASIAMIEKAGSTADVAGLEHDNASQQQYLLTTLISEGYLDIDPDDDLVVDGSYVQKVGDTGNAYEYNGTELVLSKPNPASDFEYMFVEDLLEQAGVSWDDIVAMGADSTYGSEDGILITKYLGDSKDVVIPENIEDGIVTVISTWALEGMDLTSVHIPETVVTIGIDAFKDNRLTSVDIPDSVEYMASGAFENNNLERVSLPDGIKDTDGKPAISMDAFKDNNLSEIVIPNSVERIDGGAFQNNKLTHVDIPENVSFIAASAFENNELSDLVLPESLIDIGIGAFRDNRLTSVTFLQTGPVGTIGRIGTTAFSGNNGLTIYGHAGTDSERHALARGINFVEIN